MSRLLREGNDGTYASRSETAMAIALVAANARWTLDQLRTAAMVDLLNEGGDWLRVWQRSRTDGTRTERHDADRDGVSANCGTKLQRGQRPLAAARSAQSWPRLGSQWRPSPNAGQDKAGSSDHVVLCSPLDIAVEWPDDDADRIHPADFRAAWCDRLPGGSIT
jgi:hypothetical protein